MLRTPRSLKVHAMVAPDGEAMRFSGEGKPSTCSTVKGLPAGCCAACGTELHVMLRSRRLTIAMSSFRLTRFLIKLRPPASTDTPDIRRSPSHDALPSELPAIQLLPPVRQCGRHPQCARSHPSRSQRECHHPTAYARD